MGKLKGEDTIILAMLFIIALLIIFNHGLMNENRNLRETLSSHDEVSFDAGYEEGYEEGWKEGEKFVIENISEYFET